MKRKKDQCPGGTEHPTRPGMKCWGNHHKDDAHWAEILDKGSLRHITWRD